MQVSREGLNVFLQLYYLKFVCFYTVLFLGAHTSHFRIVTSL